MRLLVWPGICLPKFFVAEEGKIQRVPKMHHFVHFFAFWE